VPNFSGTATIFAGKAKPGINPDGESRMSVFGKARLTCP
jgi:hypothetical protein